MGKVSEVRAFLLSGLVSSGDVEELLALLEELVGASAASIGTREAWAGHTLDRNIPERWKRDYVATARHDPLLAALSRQTVPAWMSVTAECKPLFGDNPCIEAMVRNGWADVLGVRLPGPFGVDHFIAIYRDRDRGPFAKRESLMLDLLLPHLVVATTSLTAQSAIRGEPGEPRNAALSRIPRRGTLTLPSGPVAWSPQAIDFLNMTLGPLTEFGWRRLTSAIVDAARAYFGGLIRPCVPIAQGVSADFVVLASERDRPKRVLVLLHGAPELPISTDHRVAAESLLTRREREVARQLVAGAKLGDVAGQCGFAKETARVHTRNIYRKLGISTRTQLLALYRR